MTYNPNQIDTDRNNIGDACEALPAVPRELKVASSDHGVSLFWKVNPEPNILGYNVYRKTPAKPYFVRVGSAFPTVLEASYELNPCIDSSEYKVSAVNFFLRESAYSKVFQVFDSDGDGICDASNAQARSWSMYLLWLFLVLLMLVAFWVFYRRWNLLKKKTA